MIFLGGLGCLGQTTSFGFFITFNFVIQNQQHLFYNQIKLMLLLELTF
jgi:hypothetical protein